jgi:serine/threonine-protein kinase
MIGARLGSWIIDKELGRGGMGMVYFARREHASDELPAQAALKVLAPELASQEGFLHRFRREIDILRKLDHPNIVRFLESGEQDGRYYFAMEFVSGPSYEVLREQRGRLPWREVLDLALQVAPALKHAHDRGVIHRDLKPSNLLHAGPDPADPGHPGLVKLTDFGIASLFASPHLTITGGIVGTAEYLSPEQAAGKPVTRRSDLYSLGVVLYTLLTGRTPFEGDLVDLLHKHRFAQFDRPARLVPDIPPELDEVVCALLAKDPADRPADGAVLFRRLDALRRRLERNDKADTEEYIDIGVPTVAPMKREGPATLMSRLMRQELLRQNRGGPVRQFLNRPWVLVALFLLTAGLIARAFWPLSPETMFRRGAALMNSADHDDWARAWDEYLGPLQEKYPDNPHRSELEEFRRRYETDRAERRAENAARWAGPMGEAQWFYQEGLRLRQQGREDEARRLWTSLVHAFREVPVERPWVRRAEKALAEPGAQAERQLDPVRDAVGRARRLRAEGKGKEAEVILDGLKALYRGDPAAEAVLEEKE